MLNDISVRAFIVSSLLILAAVLNTVEMIFSTTSDIIIGTSVVDIISILCLRWYVMRYLVMPVNTVKGSTEEVTFGNLAISTPEFDNNCASRLVPGINSLSSNISTPANEIRTSSQTVMAPSKQLAKCSTELSVKTEQQSGALVQAAVSTDEIAVNTRNNADDTQIASTQAAVATQCVIQSGKLMVQIATNMYSVAECAQQMMETVMPIGDIAFRTNVLALNAAAGATRAGEHGGGPSMVAGEVRMLTRRNADAAENIRQLIAQTHQSVQQGAAIVREAEKNMRGIVGGAGQLDQPIGEILTTTQEQEKGVIRITHALAELENVTQNNITMVDEFFDPSGILKNQVIDFQLRTYRFRLNNTLGLVRRQQA